MSKSKCCEAAEAPLIARVKELEQKRDNAVAENIKSWGRIDELEELLQVATKALEFYGRRSEHHPLGGDTAREALARLKAKE